MTVADVGAGRGQLTLALAAAVGSTGHVFSSDIDPQRARALRKAVAEAGMSNVTVVEAKASESGLPAGCCDAIVLRRVYHHVTDPAATNASSCARSPRRRARGDRYSTAALLPRAQHPRHRPADVIDEVKASGFEMLQLRTDWPGRGPFESYSRSSASPRKG